MHVNSWYAANKQTIHQYKESYASHDELSNVNVVVDCIVTIFGRSQALQQTRNHCMCTQAFHLRLPCCIELEIIR
jgi:hypothetical protein